MEGKNSPNKKHRDKNKPVAHCKKKKKKAFQTSISSMKKKKNNSESYIKYPELCAGML